MYVKKVKEVESTIIGAGQGYFKAGPHQSGGRSELRDEKVCYASLEAISPLIPTPLSTSSMCLAARHVLESEMMYITSRRMT